MKCKSYINKIDKFEDIEHLKSEDMTRILKEYKVPPECFHHIIHFLSSKINKIKKSRNKYNILTYYLEELKNYPLLTKEQEKKFFEKYEKTNDQNINKTIAESNLRLVISIAKKYISENNQSMLLDLIEEGNIGLLVAIDKYDYTRSARFATYASYWIEHYIKNYLYKNITPVKFSDRMLNKYRKYKQKIQNYINENKFKSFKEIGKRFGISKQRVSQIEKRALEKLSIKLKNLRSD